MFVHNLRSLAKFRRRAVVRGATYTSRCDDYPFETEEEPDTVCTTIGAAFLAAVIRRHYASAQEVPEGVERGCSHCGKGRRSGALSRRHNRRVFAPKP